MDYMIKVEEKFPSIDFIFILLAHLKLNGVDRVDVVELGYTLAGLYYISEYRYILGEFKLRETIKHDDILDIDNVLMDAYVFGCLDQKTRTILMDTDFINSTIIKKYDDSVNKIINDMAIAYKNRIHDKNPRYDREYIGNLFFTRKYNPKN